MRLEKAHSFQENRHRGGPALGLVENLDPLDIHAEHEHTLSSRNAPPSRVLRTLWSQSVAAVVPAVGVAPHGEEHISVETLEQCNGTVGIGVSHPAPYALNLVQRRG